MFRPFLFIAFLLAQLPATAQDWRSLNDSLVHYYNLGQFEKAADFGEQAIIIAKSEPGEITSSYALCLENTGRTYRKMSKYDLAAKKIKAALAVRTALQGPNHSAVASLHNLLGVIYAESEDYPASLEHLLTSVRIQKELPPEQRTDYRNTLNNLGFTLFEMERFDSASRVFEEELALRRMEMGEDTADYIEGLLHLSSVQKLAGEINKAAAGYEQALVLAGRKPFFESALHIRVLRETAAFYQATGNFNQAVIYYHEGIGLAPRALGALHADYGRLMNDLGVLYNKMGVYDSAEIYLKRTLDFVKLAEPNSPNHITLLHNIAALYNDVGQNEKALAVLLEANQLATKYFPPDIPLVAQNLFLLGNVYFDLADYARAENYYLQAKAIRLKQGQDLSYSHVLNNLSILYEKTGRYDAARELAESTLLIYKKYAGDQNAEYALRINNLGQIYHAMADYEMALQLTEQARQLRRKVLGEKHLDYAASLNNLANIHLEMGHPEKAEPLMLQAVEIFRQTVGPEHISYALAKNNLAMIYQRLGQYDKAKQLFLEVLALREKILGRDNLETARTLDNLGNLARIRGDYTEAEKYLLEAEKIVKQNNIPGHALTQSILTSLGKLYQRMGHYTQAEKYLSENLALRKEIYGDRHPLYASSLDALAFFYLQTENDTKAEKLFREAAEIFKKEPGPGSDSYAGVLMSLSRLAARRGDWAEAERLAIENSAIYSKGLQREMSYLSEQEKQNFLDDNSGIVSINNSFLVANPLSSEEQKVSSLNLQLLLRSLVLSETKTLTSKIRSDADPEVQKQYREWRALQVLLGKQLALTARDRSPEFPSWQKKAEELEKSLARRVRSFDQLLTTSPDYAHIRKAISTGEAVLFFTRFDYYDRKWTDSVFYGCFIIRSDRPLQFVNLFEERRLQSMLDSAGNSGKTMAEILYRGLGKKASRAELGDKLYRLIWAPLEKYLDGIRSLVYFPEGQLHGIAFHALKFDEKQLLMDRYMLKRGGDPRVILNGQNAILSVSTIHIFADPRFDAVPGNLVSVQQGINPGKGWSSLPGTRIEAKGIANVFSKKGKQTRLYLGDQASEENLKALPAQRPDIIHLATHGYFLHEPDQENEKDANSYSLSDNPLIRTGLALSAANYAWNGQLPAGNKEDGIATAYEIGQMDLSTTELVVLSACETALGEIRGSEGVFGLQRAFKLAGVKKMIVSLWQVPDKETAELMTLFYSYLLSGKSIESAFAKAQGDMRKKYPPFYWAAFVLVE